MATEEDKVNTGALITLVGVSTFAMIAVTLAVTAIARDEMGQAQEAKEGSGATQYHDMRGAQLASLSNGVTIEQSMQNVVQGLARDPGSATPPIPVTTATAAPSDGSAAAGGAPAGGAPGTAAPAAGGASAGGAPAVPAPAGKAPAAGEKVPAAAEKAGAAPKAKPVVPAAPAAAPVAPKPASGQPTPAAPATPAPATPAPATPPHG
jgi:hypothetical protein